VQDVGDALGTPSGSKLAALADLAGRTVAVAFGSPAQDLLARREDVTALTVTTSEDGMRALQEHRAAAALLWGPSAGYFNQETLHGRAHVVPLSGENLQWRTSIAFAAGDTALRDQVNQALQEDRGLITQLAARYGFPTPGDGLTTLVAADGAGDSAIEPLQIPTITKDTTDAVTPTAVPATPAQSAAAPAADGPAGALVGHVIFNGTCAACHGPDAVQAERRINLRLLHARYGDNMDVMFFNTVMDGRPTKGMPSWKGAFSNAEFHAILAYLHTVQEN
jgi:mono/diheme cytochrome c family protein